MLPSNTPSRFYTTRTLPSDEDPKSVEGETNVPTEEKKWISILENTVSAPWLFSLPPDHEQRLKIAYTLLFQIVLYLTRPAEAEQFLTAFATAPAPSESEIGRARKAVGTIIKASVNQMSSIPLNSSVRAHNEIFDIFGALQAIHDMYLGEEISTLETWSEFWSRAQPVVLELGMKLDEKGFGWSEEDLKELSENAAAKASAENP
ncbi:hypothetical protein H0H81_003617 [Sphagnurus paluster]|uniref:Uncharacterized protein n=1 Tax=Sphagnurus paluster TaxID=117069 RepID=A0A9P7K2D9_9AGAR|nr:hypothetical protein H0H81_003617 [Sphagnurus paluster]